MAMVLSGCSEPRDDQTSSIPGSGVQTWTPREDVKTWFIGTGTLRDEAGQITLSNGSWVIKDKSVAIPSLSLRNAQLRMENVSAHVHFISFYGKDFDDETNSLELVDTTLESRSISGWLGIPSLTLRNAIITGETSIRNVRLHSVRGSMDDIYSGNFLLGEHEPDLEIHARESVKFITGREAVDQPTRTRPWDASSLRVFAPELQFHDVRLESRSDINPTLLVIRGLQGHVATVFVDGNFRLDLDTWNVSSPTGLSPDIVVRGWTEAQSSRSWNIVPDPTCPNCHWAGKIIAQPLRHPCKAPQTNNFKELSSMGEGNWLVIRPRNSAIASNYTTEFQVTLYMPDGEHQYINRSLSAGKEKPESYQIPLMTRLCTGDGTAPVPVSGYTIKMVDQFNRFACGNLEPESTLWEPIMVQALPYREGEGIRNLVCEASTGSLSQ